MTKNFIRLRFGFTFVEMLLVTALLAVVGLSLYATFSNGLKIWQRINRESVTEDVHMFFEKISADLRNSAPFSVIEFRGEEDAISFPTIISSAEKQRGVQGIGRASYFFDRKNKSVNRQPYDFSEVYRDHAGPAQVLVRHVETLRFDYYYHNVREGDYSWTSTWPQENISFDKNKKEIFPLAVRIEIEAQHGGSREQFTKTISIPTAWYEQPE